MEPDNTPVQTTENPMPALGATPQRHQVSLGNIALVVALMALLLLGWQWLESRQRIALLERQLGERLAAFDVRNQESQSQATQVRGELEQFKEQLGRIENRLLESQNQQIALEALYQQLAKSQDQWALTQIEQILLIANQQLELAGNIKGAIVALQTADDRLEQMDMPQLQAVRKAIHQDIEHLQHLPPSDLEGVAKKLDEMIDDMDRLPFVNTVQSEAPLPVAPRTKGGQDGWAHLAAEVWQDFKQLVRIQTIDESQVPVLAPDQAYFLRENVKLRLLSARLSLVQRDGQAYKDDILTAQKWVKRYFDNQSSLTKAALDHLGELSNIRIDVQWPDISTSLSAMQHFSISEDKAVQ